MSNYQGKKNYKNQNQRTVPEIIITGIFKGLWWLITFPFHKGKRRSSSISSQDRQYIISKRHEIEKMTQSDNMYELKHAVIEADKLVDLVLKKKGYAGETFADRLRNAEQYMDQSMYQNLWDAHKVRNQIAHEDGKLNSSSLIQAINKLMEYAYE